MEHRKKNQYIGLNIITQYKKLKSQMANSVETEEVRKISKNKTMKRINKKNKKNEIYLCTDGITFVQVESHLYRWNHICTGGITFVQVESHHDAGKVRQKVREGVIKYLRVNRKSK